MTDEALTAAWENGLGRSITHEEHVRIARVLIREHGWDEAERRLVSGTRLNCELMDAADRFDEKLTRRWAKRIGADLSETDADAFEDFIAVHPALLRGDLLGLPAWKLSRAE
jgi:hypothetical protein